MRALILSPWVRARRRYSGGKMWQWRSTPNSERFLDALEGDSAVADLVRRLAVRSFGVPVGLERQRTLVPVPRQQLELLGPADLALPDRVPGGQAGRGVDDVAVLDVDEADAPLDRGVALGVRVAAGDEVVAGVPHRLERRVVDRVEDPAGVVAGVAPAGAHVLEP